MSKLPALKEKTIASFIYFIRGEKVMLDADLAKLYNVETRVLKQAVRRNLHWDGKNHATATLRYRSGQAPTATHQTAGPLAVSPGTNTDPINKNQI